MAKHAKFSPSKLSRILLCPASGRHEATPSSSSVYADEGTLLPHVMEQAILTWKKGQSWKVTIRSHELNAEQVNAVEDAMLYLLDLQFNPELVEVEQQVYITSDCYGTVDCLYDDGMEIHVIDWKFGAGVEVSAQDNPQTMAYATGAILRNSETMNYHQRVVMHVVQPRMSNYDTMETNVRVMMDWNDGTLQPGLWLAKSPDAPYVPSLSACRWCPAKATCTARFTNTISNAEQVFAAHAQLPEINMDLFGQILQMAEAIEQCVKDLKLHATLLLAEGKEVKGYKLVRGRSNRAWIDETMAGEFLAERLDPEEMYQMKMVSPAQAEKLLDREARKDESFTSLIHKPEGKVTIAPESDKRAPISLDAESVFANCIDTQD